MRFLRIFNHGTKTKDHEVIGVNVFLCKLTRFLRKKGLTGAPYASCVRSACERTTRRNSLLVLKTALVTQGTKELSTFAFFFCLHIYIFIITYITQTIQKAYSTFIISLMRYLCMTFLYSRKSEVNHLSKRLNEQNILA